MYDCIIIGGGISGISFACQLKKAGRKVLVLEKENEIGGQIRTCRSALYPDYWMELGSHTCYNTYVHLLSLVEDLKLGDEILGLDRCAYKLFAGGEVKGVQSEISFFSLFLHGPRLFFSSKAGKTVRDYFRPIVGATNYDHLFSKLFRAVISQNADEYPAEIFLKRRKERRKEYPRKFSFKGGLLSFLRNIVEKGGLQVHTGTEVMEVAKEDGKYRISTSDGKVLESQAVALATPAHITAGLIRSLEPAIADYFRTIPPFHSETLDIIVKKDALTLPKLAGIIPVSDEFLSIVTRDVAEHPELRSFTLHVEGQRTTEEEKRAILCRVLSLRPEDILESFSTTHSLPSLRLPHTPLLRKVEELRTQEDLFLLGNYYYGLSLEDFVHRSSDEAKRFGA